MELQRIPGLLVARKSLFHLKSDKQYRPSTYEAVISAAASFASPISYQTNLMVYGPGGYRFSDYLKMGIPLQVMIGIVALVLIYFFYF